MVSWGKIVFGPPSNYVGGSVTEFLENLGYTTYCSFFIRSPIDGFFVEVKSDKVICDISSIFKNGDRMDVYVCGESFTSFNEVEFPNPNFGSSNHPTEPSSPPSEHFNPSSQPSNPLGEPSNTHLNLLILLMMNHRMNQILNQMRSKVDRSEQSLDSDVHEEYRDFRASKRHFNRSNRRTRGTTTEQIHTTEKGPDIGYDETNVGSKDSLLGKLGGDEPYNPSDEAPSFELEEKTS
ncbi:hypothetical protein R3W88_016694 [Solanum pinnatisectum]|uniref:Uncharacterized protein n=1 Tax=Solanum pinnatisectum TaxID=50273 RepID=A0AAV9KYG8_9SOLN|nr:hypothetical protein R3W88_016694 [Solanum pinnatisectum]